MKIERAETPPSAHYSDERRYAEQLERVFADSWQLLWAIERDGPAIEPLALLPGSLDEPLVVTRERGRLRCLSNVCTHRGNLLATASGSGARLRCRYHGRCFRLDGTFESMPEFEGAEEFPRPEDDLPRRTVRSWGPFHFASLSERDDFEDWFAPVAERLKFLDPDCLRFDPSRSRDYEVAAHWALYVDNYLEGFHIPFVHPGLARELDWRDYETVLLPQGTLQIGRAAAGSPRIDLAEGPVAALYFWLFPNLMINVYPWGISLNLVEPQGPRRTRVRFRSYVADPAALGVGAGGDLDSVEIEDERVVEDVQRGVASRLYDRGRYSPSQETGVHRFHEIWMERVRKP